MQVADKYSRIIGHLVPEGDLNVKMRTLLANEIRRRLAEFDAVDRHFRHKYGGTLDEFERREVVRERGYSFEVESDHQKWDAATDAIASLRKDLDELEH